MNPKPFWPLNHFTVPVVIFFSKEHICAFRATFTRNRFNSSMSMEKEPAGAFNKAQRLNEQPKLYLIVDISKAAAGFNHAPRCGQDHRIWGRFLCGHPSRRPLWRALRMRTECAAAVSALADAA